MNAPIESGQQSAKAKNKHLPEFEAGLSLS
jgi:hypothetical protein